MKYAGPSLIADVAEEPITLNQAKLWLKIDTSPATPHEDDDLVTALIKIARQTVENEIGRPIGEQTFEVGFEAFYSAFRFPRPPLICIVSIKYTKDDGAVEVIEDQAAVPAVDSTVEYDLETLGQPGCIYLRSDQTWPSDTLANGFPVRIRYKAGYTDVPVGLIQAMRLLIAHWYENREAVSVSAGLAAIEVPLAVKYLCQPYKFTELY